MNATRLLPVNNDALLALGAHLRDNASALSLTDAVALAIRARLADNVHAAAAAAGSRGYQWKELFLPDGTAVRMRCGDEVIMRA